MFKILIQLEKNIMMFSFTKAIIIIFFINRNIINVKFHRTIKELK